MAVSSIENLISWVSSDFQEKIRERYKREQLRFFYARWQEEERKHQPTHTHSVVSRISCVTWFHGLDRGSEICFHARLVLLEPNRCSHRHLHLFSLSLSPCLPLHVLSDFHVFLIDGWSPSRKDGACKQVTSESITLSWLDASVVRCPAMTSLWQTYYC